MWTPSLSQSPQYQPPLHPLINKSPPSPKLYYGSGSGHYTKCYMNYKFPFLMKIKKSCQ